MNLRITRICHSLWHIKIEEFSMMSFDIVTSGKNSYSISLTFHICCCNILRCRIMHKPRPNIVIINIYLQVFLITKETNSCCT